MSEANRNDPWCASSGGPSHRLTGPDGGGAAASAAEGVDCLGRSGPGSTRQGSECIQLPETGPQGRIYRQLGDVRGSRRPSSLNGCTHCEKHRSPRNKAGLRGTDGNVDDCPSGLVLDS